MKKIKSYFWSKQDNTGYDLIDISIMIIGLIAVTTMAAVGTPVVM